MRNAARVIAALAVVLCTAETAWTQTATGQITGTVTDASGAVMQGVKVVVTSQQTGLTRETTTSDVGSYTVPLLPVGVYLVTAEQSGFKLAVKSDIQLNVDQVQRIDIQLETGNVTERVEVQASSTALDTETSTVGQVISERQVTQLPLNGRNFLQLLFLGAGAVETDGEQAAMRQCVCQSSASTTRRFRGSRRPSVKVRIRR
jgi:Carboxypeptidase regulatory-like domain